MKKKQLNIGINLPVDEFPEVFENVSLKKRSPRKTCHFTNLEIKRIREWKTFA